MLSLFQSRSPEWQDAHDLYRALMARARDPLYYAQLGVPDTVDGRYDLLVLYAALAMRRLRAFGEEGQTLAQALFDCMFVDMERAIREMGVGDLSVSKHMRRMMTAFYGRAMAYEAALEGRGSLAEALARNVYGTVESPPEGAPERLAAHASDFAQALETVSLEDLRRARLPATDAQAPRKFGT